MPDPLSSSERRWLLALARSTIAAAVRNEEAAEPSDRPAAVEAGRGCFVTLHGPGGTLRGCIGTFDDLPPLWRNVMQMARAAALRDPRFPPLAEAELGTCSLDISALTPMRPGRPDEVVVGRHGLAIERGGRRGVLLPQVAVEQRWEARTFLEQTCRKAGLPTDAYLDPQATLSLFEAEVFAETS